ncbi:hypothetical protein CONPUDRAFT_147220 [Coniophora puteana RWD-64-598 SS2]|uniref:Membrane-associated protein n=1 Tax=Coniophora puteana (strain RWD-64-598) TaxID=741705 RepID=A0A5M3MA65_CONPW|nr:uncharacterized protein CONPUDRAFT_147220 [Coniophora puteana RWD-64-598 SS2]EIW75680.1 hypothetical protein CONPUDRAFT_147220 [Coniophora puteana RWD-64-598 SS2]
MTSFPCRSLRGIVALASVACVFGAALPTQSPIGDGGVFFVRRDPGASTGSVAVAAYTSDAMSVTYDGDEGGSGSWDVATSTTSVATPSHSCTSSETSIPILDIETTLANDRTLEVLDGCTLAVAVLVAILLGWMVVRTHVKGRQLDKLLQTARLLKPAADSSTDSVASRSMDTDRTRNLTVSLVRTCGTHEEGEGYGWTEKTEKTGASHSSKRVLPEVPRIETMLLATPTSSWYGSSSSQTLGADYQPVSPPRALPKPGSIQHVLRNSHSEPVMKTLM